MRNITFSADEDLIKAARARAAQENTTLNEAFRLWLSEYVAPKNTSLDVKAFLSQFPQWHIERMPTRDELNER